MAPKPNQLAKTSAIVKAPRPQAPPGAIETYADTDRYKFGFAVASQTSTRKYKISFDAAPGALYWKCSCPGCISKGRCKHLQACGLKGRADMPRKDGLEFAKKHGFIA